MDEVVADVVDVVVDEVVDVVVVPPPPTNRTLLHAEHVVEHRDDAARMLRDRLAVRRWWCSDETKVLATVTGTVRVAPTSSS